MLEFTEFSYLNTPDYLNRNYHFQTDGYFSEKSAKIYEQQVEIHFSGTAAPMRRMLIKHIKNNRDELGHVRPLRILELGAGVGSASLDFSKSFAVSKYVVSDISKPYLEVAKERLSKIDPGGVFEFVQSPAEKLPFADGEFDLVFSVYLFHELPRTVRDEVLAESYRVLKKDGVLGICDSLQIGDDEKLDGVLENFPRNYHEPFYKGYTLWDASKSLSSTGFTKIASSHQLLSKYWSAVKK